MRGLGHVSVHPCGLYIVVDYLSWPTLAVVRRGFADAWVQSGA